jgi:hypothetical protein
MLISVFTPTHDHARLDTAYHSLTAQTYPDWEWVVVPNHPTPSEQQHIRAHVEAYGDPRVVVRPWPAANAFGRLEGGPQVGALKRFACEACRGELFVELDHDDWLLPGALARLAEAHRQSRAGFYYSDALITGEDKESAVFNAASGWSYYRHEHEGTDYLVARSFDVTPRSLCEIYYAPNHVRCWQKDAYWTAGGHDGRLGVADDHELLCRTYLSGAEMVLIREPLYYYLLHPGNTYLRHNEQVQKAQLHVMNRYLHPLVFEWCRRRGLPMIDLGGAHNAPAGFQTLDRDGAVDYRCDVFDMPFAPGTVGCFRAVDFLEHFPPGDGGGADVVALMNLLYGRLAHFGWLLTATPAVAAADGTVGLGAFQDPTHKSFWGENNFWYFTDRDYARYVPASRARFQAARVWTECPSAYHHSRRIPYVYADLLAVKDEGAAVPGGLRI